MTSLLRSPIPPAALRPRRCRRDCRVRAKVQNEEQQGVPSPSKPAADAEPAASPPLLGRLLAEAVSSPLVYVTLGIAVGVKVVGASDSVATVVGLSALPVVGLSLLARSPAGVALQAGVAAGAPARAAARVAARAREAAARDACPALFGPSRRRLLPAPAHLDGSLPADEGFDPLSLGAGGRLASLRTAELLHARWAMLAAPGCLVPEALARAGVPGLGECVWWKVGAAKLAGETLNWGGLAGFHVAGGQGVAVIAACQLVLMGGPEYARYVGIDSLEPVGVPLPGDADYPGGTPFDPLGLSADAQSFVRSQVDELHAGRLAMIAMLAFFVQAAVTRAGPLANLLGG